MKTSLFQIICRILIVSLISLSFHTAQAGMIGVDQAMTAGSAQAERDAVLRVIGRAEVSSQLQSMGIDSKTAVDRVAAMTDEEVRSLNGKLQALPAGASGDWGWLAAVVVIGVIIWVVWGWKR